MLRLPSISQCPQHLLELDMWTSQPSAFKACASYMHFPHAHAAHEHVGWVFNAAKKPMHAVTMWLSGYLVVNVSGAFALLMKTCTCVFVACMLL